MDFSKLKIKDIIYNIKASTATHADRATTADSADSVLGTNVSGAVAEATHAGISTTRAKTDRSTNIATTAYVKDNLNDYLLINEPSTVGYITLVDSDIITWGSLKVCNYAKWGNVVQLSLNTNGTFTNTTEAQIIGTLPVGYRPKLYTAQNYINQAGKPMLLVVDYTNGQIKLYNLTGAAINNTWICRQSLTFIV